MEYLAHYGIKGQKWGVRRYQNPDGTRTTEGKKRYSSDKKSKNINPKTVLKVGAAVAGTAAVAYLAANPKAREAAKKIVASSSKKLVGGLKNSAVRAGKAMVDGAMISIGGLAVDKLARELKKTEDGSGLTRARNKVIVDATRAGVNAAVRRNGSNSSNGGQVSKEVSDALGPPSKNSVDKNSSTYQGFFKDPSGNLRDDNVRSVIKGLVNAGYDADQINDYLRRIDNGSLKHYLLGGERMDYLIHMADGEILEHHGIKGMKWGVRRYQNADGTLTSAGRKRYGPSSSDMKTARKERNRTRNEAAVAYNKAYNYTSAHPISQFTNKAKKQKSNDLWGDYYDKQKVADTAKDNYKQVAKDYHNSDEYKAKRAKAIKVGAAVAGTALAAYGTYKVAKFVKDKNIEIATQKGKELARKYIDDNKLTVHSFWKVDGGRDAWVISGDHKQASEYNNVTKEAFKSISKTAGNLNRDTINRANALKNVTIRDAQNDKFKDAARNVTSYYYDRAKESASNRKENRYIAKQLADKARANTFNAQQDYLERGLDELRKRNTGHR